MKNIISILGMAAGIWAMTSYDQDKTPETKKVCHEKLGKDQKPLKDKAGKILQDCKVIKIHKKLEGTEVPTKK